MGDACCKLQGHRGTLERLLSQSNGSQVTQGRSTRLPDASTATVVSSGHGKTPSSNAMTRTESSLHEVAGAEASTRACVYRTSSSEPRPAQVDHRVNKVRPHSGQ